MVTQEKIIIYGIQENHILLLMLMKNGSIFSLALLEKGVCTQSIPVFDIYSISVAIHLVFFLCMWVGCKAAVGVCVSVCQLSAFPK